MKTKNGFTLIETVATLAIISLVSVALIGLSDYVLGLSQKLSTVDRMLRIREAIDGSPVIIVNENRSSYGYVGDMGGLPSTLQDLWVQGAATPRWKFNSQLKTGSGWNGPYLDTADRLALGLDGWGNSLAFTAATTADPVFGTTSVAKLTSLGKSLTLGNSDNVTVNFLQNQVFSRVQGYVRNQKGKKTNYLSGVSVSVNYPAKNNDGVLGFLSKLSALTDEFGYYFFQNIPYGNRSLTIDPLMVYADGSLVLQGGFTDTDGTQAYHDLTFNAKNFSPNDLGVATFNLTYNTFPPAWFQTIKVAGQTCYNNSTPRFGDTTITGTCSFTQKTVNGTGAILESTQIRIQSPVTDVNDIIIGNTSLGGQIQIQFQQFYSLQSGGGGASMDVQGIDFVITLWNSNNVQTGYMIVNSLNP